MARRAYDLLVDRVGFPPEDIIIDPNVFAIATGIDEHAGYAVDFIRATAWIREHLPHAKVSGGISNVSFSFRGNDAVREAIHTVFLYHAIRAGLTMGIVNAGQLGVYDQLDPQLRTLVEDVVLNRPAADGGNPTEKLVTFAESYKVSRQEGRGRSRVARRERRSAPVACTRQGHHDVRDRGHRRGPLRSRRARRAADRGDRRPADGRDERRRRSLRCGQDVPAAGREERAGDEAGRRAPDSVHRSGKGCVGYRSASEGSRRHGDGQGRRARYRQEHRRGRAPMQQLRRDRPGRHGACAEDPRDSSRAPRGRRSDCPGSSRRRSKRWRTSPEKCSAKGFRCRS